MSETPAYLKRLPSPKKTPQSYSFIILAIASLYFSVICGLPTRIFNALIPIITGLDNFVIMIINISLLFVYIILLLCCGSIADKIGYARIMRYACIATIFMSYPLLLLIESKTIIGVLLAKTFFVVLTAAFAAPFHAWAHCLFNASCRYKNISLGYSTGKVASTLILSGSFLIFEYTNNLSAVFIILVLISIVTNATLNNLYLHEQTMSLGTK
jgi:hypothetical protein